MKAGTLVKLTRSAIGVRLGSIGIITRAIQRGNEHITYTGTGTLCEVQLIGGKHNGRTVRFLDRDLEIVE